ncbi:uncharacterized protein F4822DRAFT_430424 [Hypoxylon trugodes]|uniref:uncharacterized protein n=1 Tax=Hypoxylon trugodes TaxID=326681 RepID=UPI00218D3791|nr:uncharacterized protein F4822DRAFT_430424 [Hypoxylon trugodes]KAI1387678.1 hypothetical protein F4822DRAFT_430424 [Hypoxylon trugodes]
MANTKETIELEVISYEKICSQNNAELQRLFAACQPPPIGRGIFWLDFRGSKGEEVLQHLASVNEGIYKYFQQPISAKMADFREGVERGFKDHDSIIDTFEISRDEEIQGERRLPPILDVYKTQISGMSSICDTAARDLTSALCSSLMPGTSFNVIPENESDTGIKLCLVNGEVPAWDEVAEPHTDFGIVTLVFCDFPSLELVTSHDGSGKPNWALIEPLEGCALVNVADTLQSRTNNALYSPLHRVVQPEGGQAKGVPMTAYYLRPEHVM